MITILLFFQQKNYFKSASTGKPRIVRCEVYNIFPYYANLHNEFVIALRIVEPKVKQATEWKKHTI